MFATDIVGYNFVYETTIICFALFYIITPLFSHISKPLFIHVLSSKLANGFKFHITVILLETWVFRERHNDVISATKEV